MHARTFSIPRCKRNVSDGRSLHTPLELMPGEDISVVRTQAERDAGTDSRVCRESYQL